MPHDDPTEEPWQGDEAAEQEIQELARSLETKAREAPEAKSQEEREPSKPRKILASPATALVLCLVALVLTVLNILAVPPFGFRARDLTPQEKTRHLEATIQFAKEEILGFEEEKGRLPHNLAEVGLEDKADLEYEPLPGGDFRLTAREGEKTLDVIVQVPARAGQGGGQ